MRTLRPFLAHPASVGESYPEHLAMAGRFGGRLVLAGLACLVHGLLPFLFTRTGSRTIEDLHQRMVMARRAVPASAEAAKTGSAGPPRRLEADSRS